MRYIKTYESSEDSGPKFENGDFVRITSNYGWESPPYRIKETKRSHLTNNYNYLLDTVTGGYIWREEQWLRYVPDEELDAIRYNL